MTPRLWFVMGIFLIISPGTLLSKSLQTIVNDVTLQTSMDGAKIDPDNLLQGCYGKDCIPSIDHPKFNQQPWLNNEDIIFAISYKGIQRAYPMRILNWHEIVNDVIADKAIVITFCPLCGSALAFEREVNGIITEFGVSGKLHNSDLIMYDRYEGNLWQQITGTAIVGPAAKRNETLKAVPLHTTTWKKWKQQYPNTQVLSKNTGYDRNYNQYPYGDYESNQSLFFPVNPLNEKIHVKSIVYGIELGKYAKAYRLADLKKRKTISDKIGGTKIKIYLLKSGEVNVINLETNKEIIAYRLFWFAWAAFHPNTELYQP